MYFAGFDKRQKVFPLQRMGTDVHCHLLPGVDDGVRDKDELLAGLEHLARAGIGRIWFTPHLSSADTPNKAHSLRERFAELKVLAPSGVEVRLAAEYMLDDGFANHLANDPLTLSRRHLLVETFAYTPVLKMQELIFAIRFENYIPVLAHPERYLHMTDKDYRKLKDDQCLFQLNLFSLCGAYKKEVGRRARSLLNGNMYDYAGTDAHNGKWFTQYAARLSVTKNELRSLGLLFDNNDRLWFDGESNL